MKVPKLITIDEHLIDKAKELDINLSGTVNNLLERYFDAQKHVEDTPQQCMSKLEEIKAGSQLPGVLFDELMRTSKELWASEFGMAILKKSRERKPLKNEKQKVDMDTALYPANQELLDRLNSS